MPLSSPAPRKPFHIRSINCQGYQREDGLWEVEGHLKDTRGFDVNTPWRGLIPQGEPVHDMWMRITFSEDRIIQAVEVVTDVAPYPDSCPHGVASYQNLVGLNIGAGFAKRARERVGARTSCTHQTELLRVLGSVAIQTLGVNYTHVNKSLGNATAMYGDRGARPAILESCHSYATDNPIVNELWPAFYTGPKREA